MKTLTFNKDSWHFQIATRIAGYNAPYSYPGEDHVYGDNADICTYSKYVVSGLLLLMITGALLAGVGYILAHVLLGVWFSIVLGKFFFTEIGIIGLIVLIGIVIAFGVKLLNDWRYSQRMKAEYRDGPDGFMKHAYKSWKGKYCLKINFVSKNE